MKKTSIPGDFGSTYAFPGEQIVQFECDQELALVFHVPRLSVSFLIIHPFVYPTKDLFDSLRRVADQLRVQFHTEPRHVQVKAFGASVPYCDAPYAAQSWLNDHGFVVTSFDIGKRVGRKIQLHSHTGRVGVQYVVRAAQMLLTTGTARKRIHRAEDQEQEILILTSNPVHLQLARQAIEEHRAWRAFTIERDLKRWLKSARAVPQSTALVFEDAWNRPEFPAWLRRNQKKLRLISVGSSLPAWSQEGLPEIYPDNIGWFKSGLRQLMEAEEQLPAVSAVIPLARARRKKP